MNISVMPGLTELMGQCAFHLSCMLNLSPTPRTIPVSSGGVSSKHPSLADAHAKLQGRTASPVLAETEQTPELCSAGSAS